MYIYIQCPPPTQNSNVFDALSPLFHSVALALSLSLSPGRLHSFCLSYSIFASLFLSVSLCVSLYQSLTLFLRLSRSLSFSLLGKHRPKRGGVNCKSRD